MFQDKLVLIVDNDPTIREVNQMVVEDLVGARAVLAGDGDEALQLVLRERPHLILLNLRMPRLDGFAVVTQLKSDVATRDIPVLAVSALTRPADRERALLAGCTEFVSKPFDVDSLAEIVRGCLAAK